MSEFKTDDWTEVEAPAPSGGESIDDLLSVLEGREPEDGAKQKTPDPEVTQDDPISEKERKKCELWASIIAISVDSLGGMGLQFLADDFSEAAEKKYTLSAAKMTQYKEAWAELLVFYHGEKMNPVIVVVGATIAMYLPLIVDAGKKRIAAKKSKKNPPQKKSPEAEEAEIIPEELREREDRSSRGRKKGMKRNPETGGVEMYLFIHPELGAVYSWEKEKLEKSGIKPEEEEEEKKTPSKTQKTSSKKSAKK